MEMNDKHNQDVYINKADLKKLSKSKLIKLLLLKQNAESTPKPSIKQMLKQRDIIYVEDKSFSTTEIPIPKPRKSVKEMVQEYEGNIILPAIEFRDGRKPFPVLRNIKPVPAPRNIKAILMPRTKIGQTGKALKGYTKTFEVDVRYNKDPLTQLRNTKKTLNSIQS